MTLIQRLQLDFQLMKMQDIFVLEARKTVATCLQSPRVIHTLCSISLKFP